MPEIDVPGDIRLIHGKEMGPTAAKIERETDQQAAGVVSKARAELRGEASRLAVELAEELLKNRISSQFDCTELFITEFTPVMGVHTGPGLFGIAFYSDD